MDEGGQGRGYTKGKAERTLICCSVTSSGKLLTTILSPTTPSNPGMPTWPFPCWGARRCPPPAGPLAGTAARAGAPRRAIPPPRGAWRERDFFVVMMSSRDLSMLRDCRRGVSEFPVRRSSGVPWWRGGGLVGGGEGQTRGGVGGCDSNAVVKL